MGFYSDFVRLFAGIGKIFRILAWPVKMIIRACCWYASKSDKYKDKGEFIRFGLSILIPFALIMESIFFRPVYWFMMYKRLTLMSFLPQTILFVLLALSVMASFIGALITIFGIIESSIVGLESFKPKGHSFWHDVNRYKHGKKVNFH